MKINVGLICGGQSPEHDISLFSVKNVEAAIDKNKFNSFIIKINKDGTWAHEDQELYLAPGAGKKFLRYKNHPDKYLELDIVFPILHGKNGEDGTIQGLFELCGIPYVGSGVLSSAVNMDKDVTKRLLRDAGIPVAKFLVFYVHEKNEKDKLNYKNIITELGSPFFMKPANTGSSIGVHKIKSESQFETALKEVFNYDEKIILEEYIPGREIETAVLGNTELSIGIPGEIIPHHEFYTYQAKYFDENGATVEVPAKLAPNIVTEFQELSKRAFKILCCDGFARVDFFLTAEGKIFLNEINTIPGFTNISMYPKCWEAAGLSYSELIGKLIHLGLEKHG
ncbi:MAG TPA: D-alanine--D-alanine ligase family protein [Gammaproteobacteria bacterium]|nr:D-alanine--D-alanine ligase family protein [Gammaproteobacteria bacterium]